MLRRSEKENCQYITPEVGSWNMEVGRKVERS